jgi:hypothetical protein
MHAEIPKTTDFIGDGIGRIGTLLLKKFVKGSRFQILKGILES